jgi:hypothetical protein
VARSGLQAQDERDPAVSQETSASGPRWEQYVLESASGVPEFWASHLGERERDVLFIMGKGFDPRMCRGLEMLLGAGGTGRRDVLAVEFDEGIASPSRAQDQLVVENWARLETTCAGRATLSAKTIQIWSGDGRRVGSRSAAGILASATEISSYSDVVVDVSALPRGIYVPLIAKALYLVDEKDKEKRPHPNLHVLVCEDPALDRSIRDEGIDERASYVHGFSGGLEMEATSGQPKIWIPVLGEGQKVQLGHIYDLVLPDEICPVLPSPSGDPRRADDLVLEYRELFFDRLRVEARNLIYASESNPFEVYRQIRRTILHYREALRPLGGSKAVISALSSKLLSIGVLLVAYELKQAAIEVAIAHVESQGYIMAAPRDAQDDEAAPRGELFSLWLSGECYAI